MVVKLKRLLKEGLLCWKPEGSCEKTKKLTNDGKKKKKKIEILKKMSVRKKIE